MNTTVIIIMIICATLIALVAIICDHLFERKSSEASESIISKKIVKIHRNYIAGFLGFAVILLLTSQYGGPNNAIFAYLSFGSTITSLVLSILAIFVTVQSSSDLYKQFTRIDSATDAIGKTLVKFTEAERRLELTSNVISSQMTNIVNEIDNRLEHRMQNLSDMVNNSLSQHNQLVSEEALREMIQMSSEQASQANVKMWQKWAEGFLNAQSLIGVFVLYACRLASDYGKPFKMSELFTLNHQYVFGVIITSVASGVLFAKSSDGDLVDCTFSAFNKEQLIGRIRELLPKFTEKEKGFVNTINTYYGEPLL